MEVQGTQEVQAVEAQAAQEIQAVGAKIRRIWHLDFCFTNNVVDFFH